MPVASCRCGRLTATVEGAPVRISVCHCRDCQRTTGGPFAAQARYRIGDVAIAGEWRVWERTGGSGRRAFFRWCPECGATIAYTNEGMDDLIAIPIGAFAPGELPQPTVSVYDNRRQPWIDLSDAIVRD